MLKNAIDWLSRPFGNGALKGKPLAVIGTSLGQYGGVWAHDETRKSFGIAGPRVVEDLKLSVPAKSSTASTRGRTPRWSQQVRDVVASWPPRSADTALVTEPPASPDGGSSAALLWMAPADALSVVGGRPVLRSATRRSM